MWPGYKGALFINYVPQLFFALYMFNLGGLQLGQTKAASVATTTQPQPSGLQLLGAAALAAGSTAATQPFQLGGLQAGKQQMTTATTGLTGLTGLGQASQASATTSATGTLASATAQQAAQLGLKPGSLGTPSLGTSVFPSEARVALFARPTCLFYFS